MNFKWKESHRILHLIFLGAKKSGNPSPDRVFCSSVFRPSPSRGMGVSSLFSMELTEKSHSAFIITLFL